MPIAAHGEYALLYECVDQTDKGLEQLQKETQTLCKDNTLWYLMFYILHLHCLWISAFRGC